MLSDLGAGTLAIVFISLVISISLHEAMHAFTSHWLGDDTAEKQGRISLNPLRHVDPYLTIALPLITLILFRVPLLAAKPVPFNPYRVRFAEYGAALVGVAGPLTNLLLAISSASLAKLLVASLPAGLVDAMVIFAQLNVALFVFNMIPIPPLDGSRLLYAFAPDSLQSLMAKFEQMGIVIVFILIVLFPGFTSLLINLNRAVLNILF